jgi:hypothetical protein
MSALLALASKLRQEGLEGGVNSDVCKEPEHPSTYHLLK